MCRYPAPPDPTLQRLATDRPQWLPGRAAERITQGGNFCVPPGRATPTVPRESNLTRNGSCRYRIPGTESRRRQRRTAPSPPAGAYVTTVGALTTGEYRDLLLAAGFVGTSITATLSHGDGIHSAIIQATKPAITTGQGLTITELA